MTNDQRPATGDQPWWQRLDDALNPIAVRELRQAVQGKFVTAVLMFLLVLQLVALGIFLITSNDVATDFSAGRNIFIVLQGILLATCMLFVPAYTAARMASERSDINVDLLYVTTLRPRSVIGGKLLAALMLTAVILSACMPFMTFTYFLRGIDLPSIFVLLLLDFFVVAISIQLAVFIACMPIIKVFKVLLGLAGLSLLSTMFATTMGASFSLLESGVGSMLGSWKFWGPACVVLIFGLSAMGLLFVLSVALVTPLAANRALPVRLYLACVWLLTGVIAAIWSFVQGTHIPVIIWNIVSSTVFSIAFFAAVSERGRLGRRVSQSVPRPGWGRLLAFLYYSGAAGGVAWSGLMLGLTILLAFGWSGLFPLFGEANDLRESAVVMVGFGFYAFGYAMTGLTLRRWWLNRLNPKYTWLVALILLAVGSVLPFLIALFFLGPWRDLEDLGVLLISSPFVLAIEPERLLYIAIAGTYAMVVALLNFVWFFKQVRNFRPGEMKRTAEIAEIAEVVEEV